MGVATRRPRIMRRIRIDKIRFSRHVAAGRMKDAAQVASAIAVRLEALDSPEAAQWWQKAQDCERSA